MNNDDAWEEARRRAQDAYSQLQPKNTQAWFEDYLKRAETQTGAAQEAYSRIRQMERDDQGKA